MLRRGRRLIWTCLCLLVWLVPALAGDDAPAPAKRPKIGLVLGGGGAKGIAHIGVLRAMEAMRIPIDYIAGTSMGSIIGGFYASGMSPDEIEGVLEGLDWWDAMKDRPPRRDQSFRRKEENDRYFLGFEMGIQHWTLRLPRATVAGQKLNYTLQTATVGSAAIENFDDLQIPFRCVATDIRTGEAVVLGHGNLAEAMRASMAVPGVFTPIVLDGRLLVDGGLVDNIPVDVVKAMGADIVIAVDVVGSDSKSVQDFSTMSELLSQTYTLMKRPLEVKQLAEANIVIEPWQPDLSSSDFYKVKEFVARGEKAAQDAAGKLAPLRVSEEEYRQFLARQRTPPAQPKAVRSIAVTGNHLVDERIIRHQIRTRTNEPLNPETLRKDIDRVYGLGDFERVTYRIHPDGDGYQLQFQTDEKPWGPDYVHFGLRLQSDFEHDSSFEVLLNYDATRLNQLGAEWRNDVIVGENTEVTSEFYQPTDYRGRTFVAPRLEYFSTTEPYYEGSKRVANYEVEKYGGALDTGLELAEYGEIRVGIFRGRVSASTDTGEEIDLGEDERTDVGGWQTALTLDRLDSPNFPLQGYFLNVSSRFARHYLGTEDSDYDRVWGGGQLFETTGRHTMLLAFTAGTSLGSDLPLYDQFLLGSFTGLSGYPADRFRGRYLASARLGYYYRLAQLPPGLGKAIYLGGLFDNGNTWNDPDNIAFDNLKTGTSAILGLDTVIGPIYIAFGMGEHGESQYLLSVGNRF